MAKLLSARFQIYNKSNVSGNQWDVLINIPLSNGDVNDIVVNSIVIFDLGSQNYARYKVIDLDTQGPISGTQRWIRVDFDDDITPPADIGWNDGFIAAPFDPDIPVGWITYAGEQAFNQAMIAYADNMNSWAEFKNGAAYVKTDSTAFTTILSSSDTDVQKALETLDTHTHAFSTDATGIATITTNFDGILSGSDTNVQFALETIDNHTHPAPAANVITTNTTNFNGKLSSSDTNVQTALETLDDHSHTAAEVSVDATGFVGILTTSDADVQTALSTIDGHTHPAPDATSIATITTNFNGILSGTDTDVQKALETLDDHTHAFSTDATGINTITTNFNNILSSSDTDVQKALDTLDDHNHSAAETSVDATNFVGILSTSDTDVQTALSTIDGHTHPAPDATSIAVTTTNFNGILSGSDSDVQTALDTIDDHTHTAAETSTNTASFSGILSTSDVDVQTALETLSTHGHTASEISVVTTNFNGILSASDSNIQTALETIDDHTHAAPSASAISLTTTNFNGALSSSDNTVQKALDTIDNYIVSDFDIIVDAAVDGTNAVQTAISSGHRKIGLKDGTYVWTDTIFDFSDGDSLEIIGLGNNVNINIGTPTASTFKATTATKVFQGNIINSGLAIDITNKKIYTSSDYTGNINVGDYLYFGVRFYTFFTGYAFGKFTISAIDSTSITVTEQLPFTEDIINPEFSEFFWVASSSVTPLSLLIKNVNITFTDTTNEFLNFDNSGYPYFSKIEFNNVIFNGINNFDYDGWPVHRYIFKDCELYSSTSGDLYANAEFVNCLIDGPTIQYALGFKDCIFEQNSSIKTNDYSIFTKYSMGYIINCHFKNAAYTINVGQYIGTSFTGNTGLLRDTETYIVSGILNDWSQNPVQRIVTTTQTLRKDDQIILMNHSSPITLTLPTPISNKKLIFKDISGNASTNPITISRSSLDTIDGQSSFIMNQDYAAITLIYNKSLNMWIVL